jgi:probable O-glycosylation ligase (exosortase A-associated)
MAMNLPLLYYLQESENRRWLRWLFKGMLIFTVPAIICTFSRGAWLGMAVAIAFLLLRSRRKFLIIAPALIVLIVALPLLGSILPQRVDERFDEFVKYQEEGSAESRFWNWEMCRRVGVGNPLHGGGFDFYSLEIYEKYYPEFLVRWPGKVWSCHSVWFTLFSEHGFPGFVLWVTLIISCFLSLAKIRRTDRKRNAKTVATGYAMTIEASLSAFVVSGTFLDAAYFDVFFYIVAFVIICKGLFLKNPVLEGMVPEPHIVQT